MNLFGNNEISSKLTRIVGAGVNLVFISDEYINCDKTNGNITLILPKISEFVDVNIKIGNMITLLIIISDITPSPSSNTITVVSNADDNINGSPSLIINKLLNFTLQPTPSGWTLLNAVPETSDEIPLSGTTLENPVTGSIQFASGGDFLIYQNQTIGITPFNVGVAFYDTKDVFGLISDNGVSVTGIFLKGTLLLAIGNIINFKGIQYDKDYSANYDFLSIPHKGFNDATYQAIGTSFLLNGNTVGSIKSIGTLDNFDFPIIVNGVEVTRFTTDKRQFWNDNKTNNGSNAGLQYSSLIANRAQLRSNQYGANNAGAGITTFKSRGLVIGATLSAGDGLLVGDIVQGHTGIGVTGNGLEIPLVYTQRVTVAQSNSTSLATDWTIQLCPLNGITNSIRNAFGVTSEGIQKVRESANCMAGFAVLDGAGQFVVPNTNVKATTRFILTVQDGGAVPIGNIYQSARTIGTNFTIKSNAGAGDAGVQIYYQLYEQLT